MSDKRVIMTSSDDPRATMAGEYEIDEKDSETVGGWRIVGGFERFEDAVWGFNTLCADRFDPQQSGMALSFAYRVRHGGRVLWTGRYERTESGADG